jgi:hypothetical protein
MVTFSDFQQALAREREGGPDMGYVYFDDVARQLTGEDRRLLEAELTRLCTEGDALVFALAVELQVGAAIAALRQVAENADPWRREQARKALAQLP